MSLNVTLNGAVYIIPETGETGWGGNTTSYLVAIAAGVLQKTGGSFTLSAETDFGASFGLKSLYYKSRSSNVAAAGIVRLNNNSDSISWRNAANSADLALFPNASNLLTFNGSTVYVLNAGTITNADISPSAAIAYSKLNLSNSIVNADINAAAAIDYTKLNVPAGAIVYSKLTLTNSIVNADINSAAAIAFTKMAAMTASRMVVSDTSGFLVASAWNYNATADLTTGSNDELRFTDGTTNYVALRSPASVTTHTYLMPIAAGSAGQVLSWQSGGQLQWINAAGGGTINSGTQFQLAYYAANGTTLSGLTLITGSRALQSDSNGLPVASAVTSTELGYLSGVTSAIQTQLNAKLPIAGPTFTGTLTGPTASLTNTTNQLVLGTTNTSTINSTAPSASRILTIPDPGANASFVMTEGSQTINGAKTLGNILTTIDGSAATSAIQFGTHSGLYNGGTDSLRIQIAGTERFSVDTSNTNSSGPVLISATTNQIRLGTTNTVTLTSPAPSTSRTYTIPDTGANSSFVMTDLAQTINGVKTLGNQLRLIAGDGTTPSLILGANTTTGIGNGGTNSFRVFVSGTETLSADTNGAVVSSGRLSMSSLKITSLANGTAATDAAAFGQVKILQVVQATTTTGFSTTSTSFTDTNLSASITPSSTSSKIIIMAMGQCRNSSTNNTYFTLLRGSTNLGDSTGGFGRQGNASSVTTMNAYPFYMDSPSTTSATTYKVQIRVDGTTGTWGIDSGVPQVMILMEVQ